MCVGGRPPGTVTSDPEVKCRPPPPLELQTPPDRFYGGRPRASGVRDVTVGSALHSPDDGEYSSSSAPPHTCLSLSCCQSYERLQSDYVRDDHDREFSITDLSVQIFTVPSLVSTVPLLVLEVRYAVMSVVPQLIFITSMCHMIINTMKSRLFTFFLLF